MVTVKWNNLPILSQHHDFHPAVLSILDHANATEALYDDNPKPVVFEVPPQDASLLERAASRNKVYYPYDLQSLRHSPSSIPKDVAYKSRDVADGGSAELSAYQTSWSVWNGRLNLSRPRYNLWDAMQSWRSLGTAEMTISLRYSRYWLSFDAAKDWLGIYDICQEALNRDPQDSKIRLAFSLSAAGFSGTNYTEILPLILILATDTRFRGFQRPFTTVISLCPFRWDVSRPSTISGSDNSVCSSPKANPCANYGGPSNRQQEGCEGAKTGI
jgi:hypothetical protein